MIEDYCRAKMMLHHPFVSTKLEDLLQADDGTIFSSWQDAYKHCRLNHQHPFDPLGVVLGDGLEDTETESISDEDDH
jgi:hypothetical protein